MKNLILLKTDLPKINESIKKMINQGLWFLFKINDPKAEYILKIDTVTYFLGKDGEILSKEQKHPQNINITNSVYFKGIPSPKSLTNLHLT